MEAVNAIQPIQQYRPGVPIQIRAPATLEDLEAGIQAARTGAYSVVSRSVHGHAPYNTVIRVEARGDFLALLEGSTDELPDAAELLSLPRAAAVAGLSPRTLMTAIRRGNLPATRLAPGAREWFVSRGDLHRYLMGRRRGTPAALPLDYVAPREAPA